jgi:hypothetical protein
MNENRVNRYKERLRVARRVVKDDMASLASVLTSLHTQIILRTPLQDDEDDALMQAGYHITKATDELHKAVESLKEGT